MAKVRGIGDDLSGNQSNRKGDGLTGTSPKAEIESNPPASRGWVSRIGGLLAPPQRTGNTAQQDGKAARPQSSWGRLLFGFMVYLLGSFILQPLILLIFGWLHINPAARQTLFPANTWIIGTANAYTLVYFVFLAIFIWALFRFNIIPRDPFGARANAQRRASGASGASGATNTSGGSSSAPPPAASALRHAGRRRLPMTDGTSQPLPKRSFFSFLRPRESVPTVSAKPAAKAPTKSATTAAAKPAPKISTRSTAAGDTHATPRTPASNGNTAKGGVVAKGNVATSNHDGHYDRVKAVQRSRRRKR